VRRGAPSLLAALSTLAALAACGEQPGADHARAARCGEREAIPERLPPFPEPARSRPLTERPAGRVLRLPGRPEGLAYDTRQRRLAVGINDPRAEIAFIDPDTGRVERRVPLAGGPRHLSFVRPGGELLVPAERANALVRIPTRGRPTLTRVGRGPHDAAAGPGGRAFVANEHASTLSVVEGRRVTCTLPTPANPGGLAVDEGGERVGVVGVRAATLRVYDARRLRGLAEVGVGIGPTHVVSNGRRRFYVADTRGHAIIVLRTRPLAVLSRIALPGAAPYGLAYDPGRRELWVTSTARNRVVLFRGSERARSFPTVRQPNSVAVDTLTGRVFVAGRYRELQIIDPPLDTPE
jgi:DNA-binding beta-propeller fold protein YncE